MSNETPDDSENKDDLPDEFEGRPIGSVRRRNLDRM